MDIPIKNFGIGIAFAFASLMIYIWFVAARRGGSVTVTTNDYGEQLLEFWMFVFLVPVMVLSFFHWLGDVFPDD